MSLQRPQTRTDRPAESDISVAVLYPGNRVDKMLEPLEATDMDVVIGPPDAYRRDIVILDNADRDMIKPVLRKTFANAKIVYRMRGDLYRELELWDMHPVKKWLAINGVVRGVDAVASVNQILADKAKRLSKVPVAGVAGLSKDPDDYPTADHRDSELRCITLTNANYRRKIRPIVEWAPVVDGVFRTYGGHWRVYGRGDHADLLEDALREYPTVSFEGYTERPKAALSAANCMLHPSNLDGLPNSILEGMASRLPVITNGFEAFTEYGDPLRVADSENALAAMLERATDPTWRDRYGRRGVTAVETRHSPESVGQQYVDLFQKVLADE